MVVLEADPGWGKSAFAADLGERGAACVFVRLLRDRSSTAEMLGALAASVAVAGGRSPSEPFHPSWSTPSGFRRLVADVAESRARAGESLLLVLDGADELLNRDLLSTGLFPLPAGADLVVTHRTGRRPGLPLFGVQSLREDLDADENLADLDAYLTARLAEPAATAALAASGTSRAEAHELLRTACNGLWIYAVAVLNDFLARRRGSLRGLPAGMHGYYTEILESERDAHPQGWGAERLPVLGAVAAAREPVTVAVLAEVTGLQLPVVADALARWAPVLAVDPGSGEERYSLFHGSLQRLADGGSEQAPRNPVLTSLRQACRSAHGKWANWLLQRLGPAGLPGVPAAVAGKDPYTLYLLRHGADHFTRAGRATELYTLLTIAASNQDPRPGWGLWAELQAAAGAPARHLRDVETCERALRAVTEANAPGAPPLPGLGEWLGTVLLRTTLLSTARNSPPSLLARLVTTGSLAPEAAAGLARDVPHPSQKVEALLAVAAACDDSRLALVLRQEALDAARHASIGAFAACFIPLLPQLRELILDAAAARPDIWSCSELVQCLDVSRLVIATHSAAPNADSTDASIFLAMARVAPQEALRVAGQIVQAAARLPVQAAILATFATLPADAQHPQALAEAVSVVQDAHDDAPARWPVRRLAARAALVTAGIGDSQEISTTALALAHAGMAVAVGLYAGLPLYLAAPGIVRQILEAFPGEAWAWVDSLRAVDPELAASCERVEPVEARGGEVTELVERFCADGELPPLPGAGSPDWGPLLSGAADLFVEAAAARCPPASLAELADYAAATHRWSREPLKAVVRRAHPEATQAVLEVLLALDNPALRAAGLSVLAPHLTKAQAEVAHAAAGALRDDGDALALGGAIMAILDDQEVDLDGCCRQCRGGHPAGRVGALSAGRRGKLFVAANRVAAAIPRFGQSADVLAVLGERHGDASGPDGATCDLAAVLLGLPEEWRAAALTALGSELNSEAPKRILVAAESVTTQPWRAIGLATALTSLNATAVPRDAETDDAFRRLGQETAGVLSNPAIWSGVDPQWREDALQSLAAAVDAPTKARILAAADPAEGAYYWKAVAACGDTLNPTKALQHAFTAATALRSKEPTDVPNPAAILAALAASYPREEWLPLLSSLDDYERAPLIAAAAPHVVAALGPDAYLRLTTSLGDSQRASLVAAAAPSGRWSDSASCWISHGMLTTDSTRRGLPVPSRRDAAPSQAESQPTKPPMTLRAQHCEHLIRAATTWKSRSPFCSRRSLPHPRALPGRSFGYSCAEPPTSRSTQQPPRHHASRRPGPRPTGWQRSWTWSTTSPAAVSS